MRFAGRFMQAAVDAGTAIGRSRRTAIDPSTIKRIASARPAARAVVPKAAAASKTIQAVMATKVAPQPRVIHPGLTQGRRHTRYKYCS